MRNRILTSSPAAGPRAGTTLWPKATTARASLLMDKGEVHSRDPELNF